jgi:hypothetical protein
MDAEEREALRDATEPPWSDAAEQRVLAKVLAARRGAGNDVGSASKITANAPVRRSVVRAGSIAAAAAAALVVGALATRAVRTRVDHAGGATTVAGVSAGPRMALPDGSEALLGAEGQVQVEQARPERVLLRQRRGAVTYRVRRDPGRSFEVLAGSIHVTVRGTVFDVLVLDGAVEVRVREGRVAVQDARTSVELGPHEHVRLMDSSQTGSNERTSVATEDAGALSDDDGGGGAVTSSESPPVVTARAERRAVDPSRASDESVSSLLDGVDDARAGGDNDRAASLLRRLLARELSTAQRASVNFTLSRVERARGAHRAAAMALAECVARSPAGPLAEDATAEGALAWERAGDRGRAIEVAEAYRARWPQGAHLGRLRHLAP